MLNTDGGMSQGQRNQLEGAPIGDGEKPQDHSRTKNKKFKNEGREMGIASFFTQENPPINTD